MQARPVQFAAIDAPQEQASINNIGDYDRQEHSHEPDSDGDPGDLAPIFLRYAPLEHVADVVATEHDLPGSKQPRDGDEDWQGSTEGGLHRPDARRIVGA